MLHGHLCMLKIQKDNWDHQIKKYLVLLPMQISNLDPKIYKDLNIGYKLTLKD